MYLCTRYMAILSGLLLFLTAVLITLDIIGRRFFQFSFGATDEMSSYVLAVASAWAFPYALITMGHVRVDVVTSRLPRSVQRYLSLIALVILVLFLGLLVWRAWALVMTSYNFRSHSHSVYRTPLVWPQAIWAAGYTVFLSVGVVLLVRGLVDVASRSTGHRAEKVGTASPDVGGYETLSSSDRFTGRPEG